MWNCRVYILVQGRINPVTGWKSGFLFAIRPFLVRIGELIEGERKEVIEKLMRMIVESHCM